MTYTTEELLHILGTGIDPSSEAYAQLAHRVRTHADNNLGLLCNVVLASMSFIGIKLDPTEPIALDSSDVDELQRLLKVALYLQGKYSMPVPPVTTASWSMYDWINYIDANGKWSVRATS